MTIQRLVDESDGDFFTTDVSDLEEQLGEYERVLELVNGTVRQD